MQKIKTNTNTAKKWPEVRHTGQLGGLRELHGAEGGEARVSLRGVRGAPRGTVYRLADARHWWLGK